MHVHVHVQYWRHFSSGDLEAMIEKFSQRPGIQMAAIEMGVPGLSLACVSSFPQMYIVLPTSFLPSFVLTYPLPSFTYSFSSLLHSYFHPHLFSLPSLISSPLETILERSLQSFKNSLTNSAYISKRPLLPKLLGDIIAGTAHVDDLFPYFLSHARQKYPAVTVVPQLQEISNLTQPHMW